MRSHYDPRWTTIACRCAIAACAETSSWRRRASSPTTARRTTSLVPHSPTQPFATCRPLGACEFGNDHSSAVTRDPRGLPLPSLAGAAPPGVRACPHGQHHSYDHGAARLHRARLLAPLDPHGGRSIVSSLAAEAVHRRGRGGRCANGGVRRAACDTAGLLVMQDGNAGRRGNR